MAPTRGNAYQDAVVDKTFGDTSNLLAHTGRILPVKPLCKLPCATCHHFTPLFVKQMVAMQCSQTSEGISSQGYKLNNSRPCLPFVGPENTHARTHTLMHAHSDQAPSIFPPLTLGPRGRGCSVGPAASPLNSKAFSGQREVKEVVVFPALCAFRLCKKKNNTT